MTVLSKTLHDYLREYTDDKTTEYIKIACPFSLRPQPETVGGFVFDNNFSIILVNLKLVDSIEKGCAEISKDMAALKKSMHPIATYYLNSIVNLLPDFIRAFIHEDVAQKITLGFSNVPGPREAYVMAGKKNNALGFIMPLSRSVVGSCSVISHAGVMKIGLSMDKAVMESTKPIRDIFIKNLDEMLGKEWRSTQGNEV